MLHILLVILLSAFTGAGVGYLAELAGFAPWVRTAVIVVACGIIVALVRRRAARAPDPSQG